MFKACGFWYTCWLEVVNAAEVSDVYKHGIPCVTQNRFRCRRFRLSSDVASVFGLQ